MYLKNLLLCTVIVAGFSFITGNGICEGPTSNDVSYNEVQNLQDSVSSNKKRGRALRNKFRNAQARQPQEINKQQKITPQQNDVESLWQEAQQQTELYLQQKQQQNEIEQQERSQQPKVERRKQERQNNLQLRKNYYSQEIKSNGENNSAVYDVQDSNIIRNRTPGKLRVNQEFMDELSRIYGEGPSQKALSSRSSYEKTVSEKDLERQKYYQEILKKRNSNESSLLSQSVYNRFKNLHMHDDEDSDLSTDDDWD